jgi:DNA-binding YbaB/EbfC family protein
MSNPMMAALQQLQEMQAKMAETQEALQHKTVTEEVSGGIVKVTANGGGRITKVDIKPEAVDPDDREGLEDLIITAVNKALDAAQEMASKEMDAATGGMMPDLPGLGLGF